MDHVKAMLASLRANYLRDLPSHIDDIEQLLLAFEREGFDLNRCRDLYGQVHSLKGSGGTFGVEFLTDICHPFEDLLSAVIEHPHTLKQGKIGIALRYVDLMRKACSAYTAGEEPGAELKLALHALRRSTSQTLHSALIVEGSDVVVGMLKEILLEYGFRIESVRDGYLALGRLLAEPFDILVTGLENKRLNGLALISAIQHANNRVSKNKTKTILLTTNKLGEKQVIPDFVIKKNADLKNEFRQIVEEIADAINQTSH
jgi:CheY-like chemotaxis protein/HPt (histidine-containing phosphotransfer) domain-containing protein